MNKALAGALMLALILMLGLAGCARQSSTTPPTPPPENHTIPTEHNNSIPALAETPETPPGTFSHNALQTTISAGGGHTMVISSDGNLWGWGNNFAGQVGDGTTDNHHAPVLIMGDVAVVSAGVSRTMAVTRDGGFGLGVLIMAQANTATIALYD